MTVSVQVWVFMDVKTLSTLQCFENLKGVFLAQLLQEKASRGEELLASVDKSYQSLVKALYCETAQVLEAQIEGERKRSVA